MRTHNLSLGDITSCIQHAGCWRNNSIAHELYGQVMNCPRRKYDSENNLIDIIRGSNCSPQLNVLSLDFFPNLLTLYELWCILLFCSKWNGIKWEYEWERNGGGITFFWCDFYER